MFEDNYKKNDVRMWFFHSRIGSFIIKLLIIIVVVSAIYNFFI